MKRLWLAPYTWAVVVETNRQLCAPRAALHKPSSEGYDAARELWERNRNEPMSVVEVADLCRRCHRLAPFCNYNGNTFVAIVRQIVVGLALPADQAALLRSLAGHIVAGTASPEEETAFQHIIQDLADSDSGHEHPSH